MYTCKISGLHFNVSGKCRNPANEFIRGVGYNDPAIEGSNISSTVPGMTLMHCFVFVFTIWNNNP